MVIEKVYRYCRILSFFLCQFANSFFLHMTCSPFIVRPDDKKKGKSVHSGEKREIRCKAFEGAASIKKTINAFGGEGTSAAVPARKKSRRLLVGSFPMYCRRLAFIAVS